MLLARLSRLLKAAKGSYEAASAGRVRWTSTVRCTLFPADLFSPNS